MQNLGDRNPFRGILYGIGAGPGDPELISVKGLRCLQKVPVIAFPAGVQGKPGITQQIIEPWLRPEQMQLPLEFAFVQDQRVLKQVWQAATQQVWPYLDRGQDVAFVSEGDISFYSTFTYLSQTLTELHPEAVVETIPGICSPMAAAASLGIPLTVQGDRLAIIPALHHLDDLTAALSWAEVVVLLKVSSVYPQVWQQLKQLNLLEQSAIVVRASSAQQVLYQNLEQLPELELPYFSLLIIQAKPRFGWYRFGPQT